VTGYLFEARSVEQLAACMRQIAQDDRFRSLGVAARERVERLFSRRAWVAGDERIYLQWQNG
jgi:hypothetical protein